MEGLPTYKITIDEAYNDGTEPLGVDAKDEEAAVHRVMSHKKDVDEEDEIDEEVTDYKVKKHRFK